MHAWRLDLVTKSVLTFHSKIWIYLPGTTEVQYDGKLNFATDTWSSLNYKAFVAFTIHLEDYGKLMSMLLNIVEVAQSHTGVILGGYLPVL
jgi:hypothetical protein